MPVSNENKIKLKKECSNSQCGYHEKDYADPELQSKNVCPECSSFLNCTKELEIPSPAYPKLRATHFMHPEDKSTFESLKSMTLLNPLIKKMNEYGYEKAARLLSLGDDVLVTRNCCSYIYDMVYEGCRALNISEQPDTFVNQKPEVNAYTTGVVNKMIVITSGLIELMTEDELYAVIAHELGHIKCEHVLYHMLAHFLIDFANMLGPAGFMVDAFNLALMDWYRKSELSSDRAALIVTKNNETCQKMLMKLAGGSSSIAKYINHDDFLEQAKKFKEITSGANVDNVMKTIFTLRRTHPFPVLRAAEIDEWKDSRQFKNIIKGIPNVQSGYDLRETVLCPSCGKQTPKGINWCSQCFEVLPGEEIS